MTRDWNYKQIRKRSWDAAFRKGRGSWLLLVAVAFFFAFIGVANGSQSTFIDVIDEHIGANDPLLRGNIDILKEYIVETPLVKKVPFITSDLALACIDRITRGATWMLKLLAANFAYFQRNKGEVVAVLLIGALLAMFVKFFILNVALVGRNRFVMENRFAKTVPMRRIFAPFHRENLWNLIRTMFLYKLCVSLWSLTIVGGFYKYYQYSAVPYLLAENPHITWREAKYLSKQMTRGCKWKLFLTQMSYCYIWLLKFVPFAGLLVAVPLEMTMHTELYFTLRKNVAPDERLLCELAFSGEPYTEKPDEPEFVLRDLSVSRPALGNGSSAYSITDYIFMFFIFSLMGWLWECGLHILRNHAFVNRGTLYGPWIPIYGVGGTAMVLLLDRFKDNLRKLVVLEVLVCMILEYLTSFLLDFMFNSSYWDYKTQFLNLNGRVCLAGLIAFALGGLAAIYLLAPAIAGFAGRYPKRRRIIVSVILCLAFAADVIFCLIFGFHSGEGVGGVYG